MKLIAFVSAGALAWALLFAWIITQIRYRITARHLRVELFGLPLRRIELTDIKRISKRLPSRAVRENWYCTLKPKHRFLAIQRHTGLLRTLVITPRNRYVFLAELQKAIQGVKPEVRTEALIDATPEEAEA